MSGVTIYPSVSLPFGVTAGAGVTQDTSVSAQNTIPNPGNLVLISGGFTLLMTGGSLLLV